MLSNTKPQNAVIAITIILALASGIGLVSITSFYTGSGIIIQHLDIDLQEILIYSLDPANESVNPSLAVVFSVRAPPVASGEVHLTYLRAIVYLNEVFLQYSVPQRAVTGGESVLRPGYENNITVSRTVTELTDKQVLYNASNTGEWVFGVLLTIYYYMFDPSNEFNRVLGFSHEGYTGG